MPQDPDFRKRFEKQSISVNVAPNGHEKVDVTSISVAATARDADRQRSRLEPGRDVGVKQN
ncbi:MAG TPA: hypothetical protein VEV37_03905, partial [Bryobacteraceae bacterium]|nr:hypothetical protein [Bryobacteraceae bacterium]